MKVNYLLILIILQFAVNYLSKGILKTEELTISTLAEQLTNNQIKEILNLKQKWEWLNYVFFPVLVLIKISIITGVLDIGCFFFSKEIKYKNLFNIVVKAEFVFLLVIVFKTAWFYAFQTGYTLEDLQYFYPLSTLNIIGYQGLQVWFVYPLQVLNLFEVAYWFILSYLIGREISETTDKGFSIVASSYGIGLLIWVIGAMFLTLNIS